MDYNMLSASTITGKGVTNPEGENLGDVKDIVLDMESGNVAYAVISYGGFLGIGDKYFAVPWDALSLGDDKVLLDVDKETLENAPGFDKDHWPTHPDRQFVSDVHEHYGYKPYWERNKPGNKGRTEDSFITETPGKEDRSMRGSTGAAPGTRSPENADRVQRMENKNKSDWTRINEDIESQNSKSDEGWENRPFNKPNQGVNEGTNTGSSPSKNRGLEDGPDIDRSI
jgi:sporulation protein YlmC with PRC-barrel domain